MTHWTLADIPWDRFEPNKVEFDILAVVKAAALVEHNGRDYATYLCSVFADDPEFQAVARQWGDEEIQHGEALRRWAEMADPAFDFPAAFERFTQKIKLPLSAAESVRGSRSGELVARCMVEVGTSSYYAALGERTREPVLQAICRRIAADELRHYKLFYASSRRYLDKERLGLWGRLRVAVGRIGESDDDELAYAYHAANNGDVPYDRRSANRAYIRRAYALYRPHHIERGVAMALKAVGLTPNGRMHRLATRLAWGFIRRRAARMAAV
jgi:rubrerythrin